ncbi:DUF3100 domain-containing protein [Marinomonas posidonica]|uniref:DUF3100 domain-containing protein n=1 Tax=Marinomonas posidonica (strain CECT 7376 / NCIMB 14433 / IVIA-Po-181) TaxID=491952 RepID=F6CV53_MARPP|nr:DUF3100 domain-containing protein [Marinomonas posidonica]AEF56473.1 hypothetical protein Mar181_3457 [Marinomonas posidonica IVIA-Po-181]
MKNPSSPLSLLLNWRLHLIVVVISVLSEWIGIQSIPIANAKLLFLPLFYAFALCLFVNPNITKFSAKILTKKNASIAAPLIVIGILPFIAKFGTLIGPALPKIAEAGAAMILQELGNLGTMLIAMPIAVLVFKMGREAIGATYSIAREPNIALISDRYGLKSHEGIGVMGVYVMGTMFGTIYFSLMAGFLATTGWFDPKALAMACGVGSGSMTAACSGTLASAYPEMKDELLAFAGASNLLTNATGLYVAIFIALPFSEWFYKKLSGEKNNNLTIKGAE